MPGLRSGDTHAIRRSWRFTRFAAVLRPCQKSRRRPDGKTAGRRVRHKAKKLQRRGPRVAKLMHFIWLHEDYVASLKAVWAIVLRLGGDLAEHARGDFLKMGFEPWPPPELRRDTAM